MKAIAIVGMACRFPDAEDYREFSRNLAGGRNSVSEIRPDRWSIDEFYSPDIAAPNRALSKWCAQIADADAFDHRFFSVSPREAQEMDPQQRLLLEETYRCIEDSGIHPAVLREKKTSVHVGVMATDYKQYASCLDFPIGNYSCLGNYPCILSNRISHVFGFRGASQTIDCACASSSVAIHAAKHELLRGDCDYAVAAGVSLNLHPWKYIAFSKSRMLSPDGQCKTFDARANGYVPGDGVGVLLLKRLDDALRDRDVIHGVIRGTAVNHVGESGSITAPKVEAQRDVIVAAYADAEVSADTITYVEAHGTGTSLGDPIEVEGLTRAFETFTDELRFCGIGSVKTNIGHLEAAAGVAGVIKVVLMMKERRIFRTLNVETLNPIIGFDDTPFVVAREERPWLRRRDGVPLRAGVSSFGMGGVNSHVVLEEPPVREEQADEGPPAGEPHAFVLSAKSKASLDRLLDAWRQHMQNASMREEDLGAVCATLAGGRVAYPYRFGVNVASLTDLAAALERAVAPEAAVEPADWALQMGALDRDEGGEIGGALATQAYLGACIDRGLSVTAVQGAGAGFVSALLLTDVVGADEARALLSGDAQVPLRRPRIPLWDARAGRYLRRYRVDRAYVEQLVSDLEVPPGVYEVYREKAKLLGVHQFTFKKYLGEWEASLSSCGLSLGDLLAQPRGVAASGHGPFSQRTLLFLAISSSLLRLGKQWTLRREPLAVDSRLDEISNLLVDGVMSKEAIVGLFAEGFARADMISNQMDTRQSMLSPEHAYPSLERANGRLDEVTDSLQWLEVNSAFKGALAIERPTRLLRFGALAAVSAPDCSVRLDVDGSKPFDSIDLGLAFWHTGENFLFTRPSSRSGPLASDGVHRKMALPAYRFERKAFRLPSMSKG